MTVPAWRVAAWWRILLVDVVTALLSYRVRSRCEHPPIRWHPIRGASAAAEGSLDARTSLRPDVPCSWSSAIRARLACMLRVTNEACIWLVMRTVLP